MRIFGVINMTEWFWCESCAIGDGCIGFTKEYSIKSCACYLPKRFDGTIDFDKMGD